MNTRKLEHGADVHYQDGLGRTPLMYAAQTGNLNKLRRQLERGADIEARDVFGRTALIYAAYNGQHESVRCLLEHGADINDKTDNGDTALMSALLQGAGGDLERTLHVFLTNGVDVNIGNHEGMTPLKAVTSRKAYMRNWRQREAVAEILRQAGANE